MLVIEASQIRAARALLRVEQEDLARRAEMSAVTLRRLESPREFWRVAPDMVERVRKALELLGAEFIEGGVRLRPSLEREAVLLAQDMRTIAERSARRQAAAPQMSEADLYDENGLPA